MEHKRKIDKKQQVVKKSKLETIFFEIKNKYEFLSILSHNLNFFEMKQFCSINKSFLKACNQDYIGKKFHEMKMWFFGEKQVLLFTIFIEYALRGYIVSLERIIEKEEDNVIIQTIDTIRFSTEYISIDYFDRIKSLTRTKDRDNVKNLLVEFFTERKDIYGNSILFNDIAPIVFSQQDYLVEYSQKNADSVHGIEKSFENLLERLLSFAKKDYSIIIERKQGDVILEDLFLNSIYNTRPNFDYRKQILENTFIIDTDTEDKKVWLLDSVDYILRELSLKDIAHIPKTTIN
jgi:hypothetical protein